MKYYIDITLLPDAEISLGFLWQKVYQQIHLVLVEHKTGENESAVALSIPGYGAKPFPLGNKLRLLASSSGQLEQLNISDWLSRYTDYAHVTSVKSVPEDIESYVSFQRKHVKGEGRRASSLINKAQHQSEKFGLDFEECLEKLKAISDKADSKLPFIWLESQQTKKRTPETSGRFPLFIEKVDAKAPVLGTFNCYGLSSKQDELVATVPWF
ncbi:type I-F CRISPR-associated endoribonuclease Cas6/Csy4 [Litoribrevibacter euphylliae]|uniref:Type I-F CRISPR-associated endoribonuclease Cas6/Csy4 n=1 Tax=Litoribrevibacter euphylliae TaxID=1834034 RepID=A0ABV7H786_9GAMM